MSRPQMTVAHGNAPGDTVVLTGLLRDLHHAYGDQYDIVADVSYGSLLLENPHVKLGKQRKQPGDVFVVASYQKGINDAQQRRSVHFLSYFHEDFQRQTGMAVPVTAPYPDLHLSESEKAVSPIAGRYWLLVAGGKTDAPVKVWEADRFQTVIDDLRTYGLRFVQVGSVHGNAFNPVLQNVLDLVGKTSLRALLRLIYHADGVLCGVTCAMHMAAALQKPCVVLGGGREPWWWEAYVRENTGLVCPERLTVPHRFLHTLGQLDCCQLRGCWKSVLTPQGQRPVCLKLHHGARQVIPACMAEITPAMVSDAILSYYVDATLPPWERDHVQ